MPPRPLFDFGACSCPLPQGLDRLGCYAASLGDQAGFPALPSLRSVQDGCFTSPLLGPDLRHSPALLAAGQKSMTRHRSEEHTPELQSLMRISYAVVCLKKKTTR